MKFILYFCLIISLAIITFIFWNIEYFILPWWIFLIMLSYLPQTKSQIKKEFLSPIRGKRKNFLVTFLILFGVIIVYGVTTGIFETSEQSMTNSAKRFILMFSSILITFLYAYKIGKIKNKCKES